MKPRSAILAAVAMLFAFGSGTVNAQNRRLVNGGFWNPGSGPVAADESFFPLARPTYLRSRELARETYEDDRLEAEEERLASALHIPYSSRDGLTGGTVKCQPLCSVVVVLFRAPLAGSSTQALAKALSAVSPILVGTYPARGLRAPVRHNEMMWFPRKVHPRYPCDCAIQTNGIGDAAASFESLDGAEKLPSDVKYTRGEAEDALRRQLSTLDPRPDGTPGQTVVVVSAGNRARLCHRFSFKLESRRHIVDVEDVSLEVVKMVPIDEAERRPPPW